MRYFNLIFALCYLGFSVLPATQAVAQCKMIEKTSCCSKKSASCCTPAATSDCCSFESEKPSYPKNHVFTGNLKLFFVSVALPSHFNFVVYRASTSSKEPLAHVKRPPPNKIYLRIGKILLFDSEEESIST